MKRLLVIGATGFVGRHVARELLSCGYSVRCVARKPARAQGLAEAGCEVVQGDISDLASIKSAVAGVEAVYVSIHTISPQHASTSGQGFTEVESNGLRNVVTACQAQGVRRLIYITSLGVAADATSEWTRERWGMEQMLLGSGLDVTVIRPGQIVGVGGHGFDTTLSDAKKPLAVNLGDGRRRMRNIAVDDLVYYLVGVLGDPRSFGQCYDVGGDEVLSSNQMVDVAADVLGRPHPIKIDIPRLLHGPIAARIERRNRLPKGSIKGMLSGGGDMVGDPMPIRAILPRTPLSYRQAVERALAGGAAST